MEMDMATTPTLADFAGTWDLTAMVDGSPDPVPVKLVGSANGTEWMMTLPDRDPIATQASMSGDSLILQAPEYESVLRAGVMVSTRTAAVLHDGRMVGKLTATYRTPDGEEIVGGTMEGGRGGM